MFCPNCGQEVAEGAGFCGQCGLRIEQTTSAPQPTRRRGLVALGVYLLIVVILGGVAWYFLVRPEGGEPQATTDSSLVTANPDPTTIAADTTEPTPTTTIPDVMVEPTVTNTPTPTKPPTSSPTPAPSYTPQPTVTLAPSLTPTPTLNPGTETFVMGHSVNDKPIEVVRFGNGPQNVIFVGGLHAGFAPGTVSLAQQAITYFEQNPGVVPPNQTIYIVKSANPDSPNAPGQLNGRLNANGVDLNRNWDCDWVSDARWRGDIVRGSGGPAPFSEPETQSLRDFIWEKQPVAVVFWEARAENGLVSPGNCGARSQASETLATAYGAAADYLIADFEALTNQVVNGDGANWLDQQGIPAIAVLLPQYSSTDWQPNLEGILAVLQYYAE